MTEIMDVIKKLRAGAKKRNFPQTFDLIVVLKEVDIRKPENRINESLTLPHGKGKDAKIAIFSDEIKESGVEIVNSKTIAVLGKDRRRAKKLVRKIDFFLAEPKLMPIIGKNLGQFLAPRGKMPRVITGDVKTLVENLKKSIRIRLKDSPVIQCPVGVENMEDEKIAENIKAVLNFLEEKLPKGKGNIKKILLKLTMSKPITIKV